MSKLLRANFACLWKNRTFWLCMASVVVVVILLAMVESINSSPEYVIFEGYTYISMMLSVFVGMFIGMEYSDGTVRNKIIAGHSRLSIYFANLIVCSAASVMMYLLSILVIALCAAAMRWEFIIPAGRLFLVVLCSFVSVMACTAIFVLVCMLVCNRSQSLIISIFILVILSVAGEKINIVLNEDEYNDIYVEDETYADESGEWQTVKNPNYTEGMKRRVYQFLNNFLPSCQMMQMRDFPAYYEIKMYYADEGYDTSYYEKEIGNIKNLPLYSFLLIIMTAAAGGFFFCKRNLR